MGTSSRSVEVRRQLRSDLNESGAAGVLLTFMFQGSQPGPRQRCASPPERRAGAAHAVGSGRFVVMFVRCCRVVGTRDSSLNPSDTRAVDPTVLNQINLLPAE